MTCTFTSDPLFKMAERAGFEPAVHLLGAYNRLAGDRFRPLSHLSALLPVYLKNGDKKLPLVFVFLAEGAGFEPARLSPNGFQDRRHRPLGHPSRNIKIFITLQTALRSNSFQASHIRTQRLRDNHTTVSLLIVFQHCHNRSAYGQS